MIEESSKEILFRWVRPCWSRTNVRTSRTQCQSTCWSCWFNHRNQTTKLYSENTNHWKSFVCVFFCLVQSQLKLVEQLHEQARVELQQRTEETNQSTVQILELTSKLVRQTFHPWIKFLCRSLDNSWKWNETIANVQCKCSNQNERINWRDCTLNWNHSFSLEMCCCVCLD